MNNFTKATSLLFALIIVVALAGCKRESGCTDPSASNYNANANVDNGTCQYGAGAIFYTDIPLNGNATVTISNLNPSTGTIPVGNYYNGGSGNAPACGTSGYANFSTTFPASTTQQSYAFSVALNGSGGVGWSGNVTLTQAQCSPVLLPACNLTFYTTNANYGPISVTINGVSYTITNAVSSVPAVSPASGCANFTLPAATGASYSYTAVTTQNNSGSWSGTLPGNGNAPLSDAQNVFILLN